MLRPSAATKDEVYGAIVLDETGLCLVLGSGYKCR